MPTPIENNTTKLQELKTKAEGLPDKTPPVKLQEKMATPSTVVQEVIPDSEFDGLSKVTVNTIPTTIHISKIYCWNDRFTRAPAPGGYDFSIYLNKKEIANISYSPDSEFQFEANFDLDLANDTFAVVATKYADYCVFNFTDNYQAISVGGIFIS